MGSFLGSLTIHLPLKVPFPTSPNNEYPLVYVHTHICTILEGVSWEEGIPVGLHPSGVVQGKAPLSHIQFKVMG